MLFKGSNGYFVKPPRKPGKKGFEPVYYPDNELRKRLCTAAVPMLRAVAQKASN